MFPFNLPGPQFLLFYGITCAGLILFCKWWQDRQEDGPVPKIDFNDPYCLAYLRGGPYEATRIATFSLMDRGLLAQEPHGLRNSNVNNLELVRRPIEKELIKNFFASAEIDFRRVNPAVYEPFEAQLQALRLLPDSYCRSKRQRLLGQALGVIWSLASIKLMVAFSSGHRNVAFLIAMAFFSTLLCAYVIQRRQTYLGKKAMADLQSLFQRLRQRRSQISTGGATSEAVLLAALYGIEALPSMFAATKKMLTPRRPNNEGSCASNCSSCGGGGGGCGGGD